MKNELQKSFYVAIVLIVLFVVWTVAVQFVDVMKIGPNNSSIGFGTLNLFIHKLIGSNMTLYIITDWLGLVPIFCCFCFGLLGLIQWIKRKSIMRVDADILILGLFYILVIFVYIFFEFYKVNYRPILINGYLEISYPSSTTMLVISVMSTTIIQLNERIKNKVYNKIILSIIILFIIFMVIGRIFSGVHWISDIIGGVLISFGLVYFYVFLIKLFK